MPMLDLATFVKAHSFKSAPFQTCLESLNWLQVDIAIMLFTGMCNNRVYCPTLEVVKDELKMIWENDDHYVVVFLSTQSDIIRYALFERNETKRLTTATTAEVQTLLEYWASFLNRDEKPDGTAITSSLRPPRRNR